MKSCYTFLILLLLSVTAVAQTTIFDFEGTAPTFEDFNGSVSTIIANPDVNEPNTSANVVQNVLPIAQGFAGIKITQNIDLGAGKDFTMQVWSPIANAPVLLKFEGSASAPNIERAANFTGAANSWQELNFSFIEEGNNVYPFVVVFMNFNVNTNTTPLTFYWDNLVQYPTIAPDGVQMDLPVTFDDPNVNYGVVGFEGATGDIVADPVDAANKVGQVTKGPDSGTAGGATVTSLPGGPVGFASPIPFTATATTMSVRVWSPTANIPIRLKVEKAGDPTVSVETTTMLTVAAAWDTLVFDFAQEATGTAALNLGSVYNMASIFFDFGSIPGATTDYYFDDMSFGGIGGGTGGGDTPMVPAPTPTRDAANVISMFSNAYTNVPVDTWRTDWSDATLTDIQIQGNDTKQYDNLVFVGVETVGSPIDLEAAGMTHMHVDYWTADMDSLRIKLVDFLGDGFEGGNGDTEDELTFTGKQGSWESLDIPLEDFAMSAKSDINQLLFVGVPAGRVFIDNVYFYKNVPNATNTPVTGLLEAFPNPAGDVVNITAPVRMQSLTLYNTQGQVVGKWAPNAERFAVNLEHLAPGSYYALARTSQGLMTIKLMKR